VAPLASPGAGIDSAGPARRAKLLASVYGRFSEGFETADLIAAKAVLEALPRADRTPSSSG
jgi:hypothetical protein